MSMAGGQFSSLKKKCFVLLALGFFVSTVGYCLPQGTQVVEGTASFEQVDSSTLNITAGENSILEYSSFDIAAGESVNFFLPTINSFSLNRILGSTPTTIAGTLTANGNLILVNLHGFEFSNTASVNVGGLIVSTHDITNNNFLSGNYIFAGTDVDPDAFISNKGVIETREGGMAVFVSDAMDNQGTITAPLGSVALAAGKVVTVGMSGDGLVSIGIDEATANDVLDAAGNPIVDQIKNSGILSGQSGKVVLKAESVAGVFQKAMNLEGVVKANSILVGEDGTIELVASSKPVYLNATLATDNFLIGQNTEVYANSSTVDVYKDWDNRGSFHGDFSSVEFKGPDTTKVLGDNTFYNFTSLAPGKIIEFEAGKTQTILGTWKIQGAYAQHIRLISTQYGSQWLVDPKGPRDLSYSWIQDSRNIHPDIMIPVESTSRENNTNWDPVGTWTGAVNSNWSDGGNWNGLGGSPPGSGDDVVFDNTSDVNSTVDASFTGTIYSFFVNSGYDGTITLARSLQMEDTTDGRGFSLGSSGATVTVGSNLFDSNSDINITAGTFSATGTVQIGRDLSVSGGTVTLSSASLDFNSSAGFAQTINTGGNTLGALTYSGTGSLTVQTNDFTVGGAFNITGGGAFDANGRAGTVTGLTTVSSGSYTGGTGAQNLNGGLTVSGGTFTAGTTTNVGGNFTVSSGSFVEGTGTVVLNGGAATIDVVTSETFNNLTIDSTNIKTVAASDTLIVTGTLTLTDGSINQTTIPAGGTIAGRGNIVQASTFDGGTGRLQIDGTATQTFTGNATTSAGNLPDITINKTGGDITFSGTIRSSGQGTGAWTYTAGTVDMTTNDTLVVFDGTTTLDGTGTVSMTFDNLRFDGGTTTLAGALVLAGNLTITATGALDVSASNFAITIGGNWSNSGTYTQRAGLVTFNSSGTQTVDNGTSSFNDITHSGTGTLQFAANITQTAASGLAFTQSAGVVYLNGFNWTGSTAITLSNTATIRLQGGETITNVTQDTNSGTWEYVGDGDGVADTFTMRDFGTTDYFNITINSATGTADTFQSAAAKSFAGALVVTAGTYDANTSTTTVTGTTTIDGGTYLAGTATQTFTGAFSQTSGTFNGQSATLDYNGTWSLSGGTFTATSGTMTAASTFTVSGSPTFNHNSGTVTFDGGTVTLTTLSITFNNLTVSNLGTSTKTLANGSSPTVAGTLTMAGVNSASLLVAATGGATINLTGNLVVSTGGLGDEDLTININGTGAQSISQGAATFRALLVVNKASGTLTLASNFTPSLTATITITQGTIDLSTFTFDVNVAYTQNGGTINVSSGVFTIASAANLNAGTISGLVTFDGTNVTVTAASGFSFQNVTFAPTGTSTTTLAGAGWTIPGTLTMAGGNSGAVIAGLGGGTTINLTGNIVVDTGILGDGNLNLNINGTGAQTISQGVGAFRTATNVNKSSGTVTLLSNVTFSSPGGSLTVTLGTIDLSTFTLDINASITYIQDGGTVNVNSGAFLIASGATFNAGTISGLVSFDGSNVTVTAASGFTFGSVTFAIGGSSTTTLAGTGWTISGTLTMAGGNSAAVVAGSVGGTTVSLTSSGSFVLTQGFFGDGNLTLSFAGTSAQTFSRTAGTFSPNVIIANTSANVSLLTAMTVTSGRTFTINSSATFNLAGFAWTMTGVTFSNNGTVRAIGSETVTGLTQDTDSGTFLYVGDNDGAADTFTLPDNGSTDYYNLTITSTDTAANADTFQSGAAKVIAGAFSITSGTYNANNNATTVTGLTTVNGGTYVVNGSATQTFNGGYSQPGSDFNGGTGTVDVNGDLTIAGGTYTATSGTTFVSGNFAHTGGTFSHNNGTVNLDGGGGTNQVISGTTTFYNLTKTTTVANTLTFTAGTTQTIANTLTIQGAAGQLISIRSSISGTQASIAPQGTRSVTRVDVKDNNNTVLPRIAPTFSVNSGNNTNWFYVAIWEGDISTDYGTAGNWDGNQVPEGSDTVTIPDVTNDPILDTAREVGTITIDAGAVLYLNGFNYTINETFVNNGTVQLQGIETVSLTQDIDSGTFEYKGRNIAETITIKDFGSTDYYNLVINDTNTNKATFNLGAAQVIANNLTVTSGTYDGAGANSTIRGTTTVNGGTYIPGSGTATYQGSFTYSSGTITASVGTMFFNPDFGTTDTITGSFSANHMTFDGFGGRNDIASGTVITVNGTLTGSQYAFRNYQLGGSGAIHAKADINQREGGWSPASGSSPSLVINGTGDQILTGGGVVSELPDLTINKSSGSLTLTGTARTIRNVTYTAGTLAGTGTLALDAFPSIFSGSAIVVSGNSMTMPWNLDLANWIKGTITINNTVIVTGTLTFKMGLESILNGSGALRARGNIVQGGDYGVQEAASNFSFIIDGTGAQTFTGASTDTRAGLPPVTIEKASGTLTLAGTIRSNRNWTHTQGTVDPGTSTFVLRRPDGTSANLTGPTTFNNLTVEGHIGTTTVSGAITVNGDLNLPSAGYGNTINGGSIEVKGNFNQNLVGAGGTTIVKLVGTGTQAITGGGLFLPNIEINKPSGTLNLSGTIGFTGATWTYTAGTVDAGTSTVVFRSTGNQTVMGNNTFNNFTKLFIPGFAPTLTFEAGKTMTVSGALNLQGGLGNLLSLRSTSPSSQWNLNAQGTVNLGYLDVQDSNSQSSISASSSVSSGNNVNWMI
jgi:filamentous hemagglutinin family protein